MFVVIILAAMLHTVVMELPLNRNLQQAHKGLEVIQSASQISKDRSWSGRYLGMEGGLIR